MTFKDACNLKSNQTAEATNVVHLSNLCTEITEVSSKQETAVCNLGSINLAKHITDGAFDFAKLENTVRMAVTFLDRVIDINFYPIRPAGTANRRWRPVGLGMMGLQDVFFALRSPLTLPNRDSFRNRFRKRFTFTLWRGPRLLPPSSARIPHLRKPAPRKAFCNSICGASTPEDPARWNQLRDQIRRTGLRNSLLVAVAPTATIASIVGAYECIEPQLSNLFKRETLSGDFLQINRYLVNELKSLGLWTADVRTRIKMADGSVQHISENLRPRFAQSTARPGKFRCVR